MEDKRTNVQQLEQAVIDTGWYKGRLTLTLVVEGEFEGFWGRANEDWNFRVRISVSCDDPKIPSFELVGNRNQRLEDLAREAITRFSQLPIR